MTDQTEPDERFFDADEAVASDALPHRPRNPTHRDVIAEMARARAERARSHPYNPESAIDARWRELYLERTVAFNRANREAVIQRWLVDGVIFVQTVMLAVALWHFW